MRFLAWPVAWKLLAGLLVIGLVVKACGVGEPDNPADLVCIGAKEYDVGDGDDRQEVLSHLSEWGSDPSKILQRPPCDMLGSPVSPETISKLINGPEQEVAD
jgi:hypothetical protein